MRHRPRGRVCRSKWTNFQTWAAQKIEALLNQSHTPTELDGCDEAHSTVVLFRNWWPAFQRREQVGEPAVVFGIVGAGIGDKWFIGDLLQTDFASPRERMRGMRGQPDTVTAKFLEHDSGQDFWWHLNQQGDVQLAVAQSAQHFPGGHVVKLNAYAGILFVKKTQCAREQFHCQRRRVADVNFAELREGFQRYAPVGALVAVILFVEVALVVTGSSIACASKRRP